MPAFRSHETATVIEAWDGPEQKTHVRSGEDRAYYGKIFAWYDPDLDEGNKGTYKFIHHMVGTDGEPGAANTNGCSAGIGVLNGGRGGTTIPDGDRQGVYDHLAKHIRDAGLEPPELQGSLSSEFEFVKNQEFEFGKIYEPVELLRRASAEIWAIWQPALIARLSTPAMPHAAGDRVAVTRPGPKSGRLVRVPIFGEISRRDSFWSFLFGGATVQGLMKTLQEIAGDDSISTVLVDVDSPGGTVAGIPELANQVRRLAESKHVVAMANSVMASAAYWIASQADEIVAAPEALVGSIGVFAVHEDWSKALEQAGIKISYISAGRYKTEGNFDEPLSDEARAAMQGVVDEAYRLFVDDVAKGRAVSAATVRNDYGEGRVLTAKDAKAAGLVDRIASFNDTVQRLSGVKAEAPTPALPRKAGEGDNTGNSRTLAHLRRRLELAEKI